MRLQLLLPISSEKCFPFPLPLQSSILHHSVPIEAPSGIEVHVVIDDPYYTDRLIVIHLHCHFSASNSSSRELWKNSSRRFVQESFKETIAQAVYLVILIN